MLHTVLPYSREHTQRSILMLAAKDSCHWSCLVNVNLHQKSFFETCPKLAKTNLQPKSPIIFCMILSCSLFHIISSKFHGEKFRLRPETSSVWDALRGAWIPRLLLLSFGLLGIYRDGGPSLEGFVVPKS